MDTNEPVVQKAPKQVDNDPIHEHLVDEEVTPTGCGILGRYPVLSVLGFAAVGIAVGVGLSFWEPEDMETKDKVLKWIGLIGDLFIRALKCVVLPLVFVNVIISIVDMMTVGKAGSIGWKTIVLYLLTTIVASLFGIFTSLMFKGLYTQGEFSAPGEAFVSLGCTEEGYYVAEGDNGTLSCSANYGDEADINFVIADLSQTFTKNSGGPANSISLSDTVYEGVFTKLITDNLSEAFVEGNFAAVVVFAICFGVALSKLLSKLDQAGEKSSLMSFFQELDNCLLTIINWIIMITPFAVLSLIIKAIGGQENLKDAFANVGYLVVATVLAMILQYFVVYVGFYFMATRTNPFTYLRHMIPAQTMAFACASSAATIPMTLKCVRSTGQVSDPIGRFVIPLGATVNMDGGAIYFPCACIWLAYLNGITPDVGSYILLVIISTIGSAGTAPVPSASLVLIITAYNTVFNTSGTPDGFSFILAIDWFMDRLRTTLNVTGDTIVCGIVAHICPLDAPLDTTGRVVKEDNSSSDEQDDVLSA